jgi:hypothetical protein
MASISLSHKKFEPPEYWRGTTLCSNDDGEAHGS